MLGTVSTVLWWIDIPGGIDNQHLCQSTPDSHFVDLGADVPGPSYPLARLTPGKLSLLAKGLES